MFDSHAKRQIVMFYLKAAAEDGITTVTATGLRTRNGFLRQLLTDADVDTALGELCGQKSILSEVSGEFVIKANLADWRQKALFGAAEDEFRTQIGGNLIAIAGKIPIGVLADLHKNGSSDRGWDFFRDRLHVASRQYDTLMKLAVAWDGLRTRQALGDPEACLDSAKKLVDVLQEVFGFEITRSEEVPQLALPTVYCEVRFSGLADVFRLRLYCVATALELGGCAAHVAATFPVEHIGILYLPDNVQSLEAFALPGRQLIRLHEGPLKIAASSRHPKDAFDKELLGQADLGIVSPYAAHGPVPSAMFVGRETELALLVGKKDKSFAIYGPRRIGKTSLAKQLQFVLGGDPRHGEVPVYTDCGVAESAADVFGELSQLLHLTWDRQQSYAAFVSAVRRAHTRQAPNGRFVLILDEVDFLIVREERHADFFRALRALMNAQLVRVVACGFRDLRRVSRRANHPVFNMLQPIQLGNLEQNAAENLIIQPMGALGLSFDPGETQVARYLLSNATTTHPGAIQFLCDRVLNILNAEKTRCLCTAHIDRAVNSEDFADYVLDGLMGLTEDELHIVSLHTVVDSAPLAQIITNCSGVLPEKRIRKAVAGLLDWMILRESEGMYSYALPAIPRVVRRVGAARLRGDWSQRRPKR